MNVGGVGAQLYVYQQVLSAEGRRLEEELDRVLVEVAEAGYDGAEGFLTLCRDEAAAVRTRSAFERAGIRVAGLYTGGAFHNPDLQERTIQSVLEQARRARELPCPTIVCNPDPVGRDKTEEELRTQAEGLNRLGEALRRLGMRLLIHHHDPEMRQNARELRETIRWTDPALVGFCPDVHWMVRGGEDPIPLLEAMGERIEEVHLRQSVGGVWAEAFEGTGDVDYRQVAKTLATVGFSGWLIVELAYESRTPRTRPMGENLRRSRQAVRELFGA